MHHITLIASVHKEKGKCHSNALVDILEEISPTVIFEELSPKKFKGVYVDKNLADSLETSAIKKYLLSEQVVHIPVDLEFDESTEKAIRLKTQKMFNTFNQYKEIQHLNNKIEILTWEQGFQFLNSDDYLEIMEHISSIEKEILKLFDQKDFFESHLERIKSYDNRENEMIKNIYSYSASNEFNNAVFIAGAAHRKSIIEKVTKIETTINQNVDWNFYHFRN
jgi:hypothetical protein